jgi:hypothetical protein
MGETIAPGSVDTHKEQEILGGFIDDVFCELLGYTRAVDNSKRQTISREKDVQANGKLADAMPAELGPEENLSEYDFRPRSVLAAAETVSISVSESQRRARM